MCLSSKGRLTCIGCLSVLPWLAMMVLLAGCPQGGVDNDNDNDNGSGSGLGEIITPSSSFGISLLDPPVQVRYSVPSSATDISGYRFPVADISLNSPSIGDDVIIATNLQAGSNKFFDFDPSEAGVGFFRVGVSFTLNGDSDFAESQAVIQVQGPPDPVFILPASSLTVVRQGDVVDVSFDARDPEGQVAWRAFYLSSQDSLTAPADRLGTQLATGTGNAGVITFRTEGVSPGDYILGVSATDSGLSIAGTVAAGQASRIVTIPNDQASTPTVRILSPDATGAPTITITNPGNADIALFRDETFTIQFTATAPQGGPDASVEVFYDLDTTVSNGFTLIAEDLPVSATQVEFPTGVPEGTYFIGATVRDGVNNPVTDYATGRVIVSRSIILDVTEPNTTLAVPPGESVSIRWTTNAPDDSGTVDVFAQRLTSSGAPTGPIIPILTGAPMSTRSATFSSATPGLFRITVRLNLTDEADIQEDAPRPVRVSSLPSVAWLGSIVEPNPRLDGAIFGGVNVEDNAGSGFAKADDFDGDGLNEFVIAARYGKPFFINPTGIGPGEAYVIYGERGASRLNGEYNLNSVGTELLRGVTLTGVRTIGNTSQTEGLADLLSIPDADDDEIEELVFGFPRTNSEAFGERLGVGAIINLADGSHADVPHFSSGGVVIVSSTNSVFSNPETLNPVLNLDRVGRNFSDETITPLDADIVFDDRLQFEENLETPGCIDGGDGVLDTIIGPSIGFSTRLAQPQWLWIPSDFVYVGPGEEEADEVCHTQFELENPEDLDACANIFFLGSNAGSGFYPTTAVPQQPLGARLLGIAPNDAFGTTITLSRPTGPGGPSELVVSAPDRGTGGEAFMARVTNAWNDFENSIRPKPHQYVVDRNSFCGDNRIGGFPSDINLIGDAGDDIENMLGIDDFNNDGRGDMVVGAPFANGGRGRTYIAYRREPGSGGLEGDFILSKIGVAPENPERLDGLLITSDTIDSLGFSLAGGFDFNNDGISDVVIGSPDAGTGTGEVIVLFGGTLILSPEGGFTVQQLLTQVRTASGGPVAVRIRGARIAGEKGRFGFNVANAGDLDGDGTDDLLVAAPDATPRFDADPNDAVDVLNTPGVDIDLDGSRDEVPGPDELTNAGLVYVIFGDNRLDQIRTCQGSGTPCTSAADCAGAACTLTDPTVAIEQLGTPRLRGLIIAGRRAGDRLGGGDAGEPDLGGIAAKSGQGRSRGLGTAGDVDGDGREDLLIGAILADPRRDPNTGVGVQNGGEVYLLYGSNVP